jgi:hypothetical protein
VIWGPQRQRTKGTAEVRQWIAGYQRIKTLDSRPLSTLSGRSLSREEFALAKRRRTGARKALAHQHQHLQRLLANAASCRESVFLAFYLDGVPRLWARDTVHLYILVSLGDKPGL